MQLPLVTFFVLGYNQQDWIEQACETALGQDYPNLEVILSDDCSTDQTFERMQSVASRYSGGHRVRLNRNPHNLGLVGHINLAFEIAGGEFIVAAAGDDLSTPQRVSALVAAAHSHGVGARLVHSDVLTLGAEGARPGLLRPGSLVQRPHDLAALAGSDRLYIGATGMWHRELYTAFGPIREAGSYEDLVLGFRAALLGGLVYCPNPLVCYRVGVGMSAERRFGLLDLSGRSAFRLRRLRAHVASLRQRASDLLSLGRGGEAAEVRSVHAAMRRAQLRLEFHQDLGAFLRGRVLRGPSWEALGVLLRESAFVLAARG